MKKQTQSPENPKTCKEAGDMFTQACIASIHLTGEVDRKALEDMETNYWNIPDSRERYKSLVKGYHSIRLALMASGNTIEARLLKEKESRAKLKYYWNFGPRPVALWSWLTGPEGLKHFLLLWSSMVFLIFPLVYSAGDLLRSSSGPLSPWDYVYFSICTATTLVYGDIMPCGLGKFIAVTEGVFSYFGLGLLFWILMEKFEH